MSNLSLFAMFPDQETARAHIEARRWPTGTICPFCGTGDRIGVRKNGFYRCNACKEDFTVRTGTIFERSHIPLHKWLYAMYWLMTMDGVSSVQLSKDLNVTQTTAWLMLERFIEVMPEMGNKTGAHSLQKLLYAVRFTSNKDDECFIKIGITAGTVKQRFLRETTYYDMKILYESNLLDSRTARKIESTLHTALKNYSYQPTWPLLAGGNAECFIIDEVLLHTTLREFVGE